MRTTLESASSPAADHQQSAAPFSRKRSKRVPAVMGITLLVVLALATAWYNGLGQSNDIERTGTFDKAEAAAAQAAATDPAPPADPLLPEQQPGLKMIGK